MTKELQKIVCPDVSCRYGAPMGRGGLRGDPSYPYQVHVFRLTMVDGAYDVGGVYWGCPGPSGAMYAAYAAPFWDEAVQADDEGLIMFMRAKSLAEARKVVLEAYPNATIIR